MKKTLKEGKLAKGFPSIALQLYTVIPETGVALPPAYFIFNFIVHPTGNPLKLSKIFTLLSLLMLQRH